MLPRTHSRRKEDSLLVPQFDVAPKSLTPASAAFQLQRFAARWFRILERQILQVFLGSNAQLNFDNVADLEGIGIRF